MNELGLLLDEATGALSRMDAEALESLELRALALQTALAGVPAADVMAKFRVFNGVLQGTGKGLSVLRRVRGEGAAWEA